GARPGAQGGAAPAADDEGDPGTAFDLRCPAAMGLRGAAACWTYGRCDRAFCCLPQDHPHLVLDRAAGLGRAQPEAGFEVVIELADGQTGHSAVPLG
ncbi:MAG TPA: hypothetical protein DCR50_18205, partial [Afipia sp.]|nr:hypothetical protein [Afipia sp.]